MKKEEGLTQSEFIKNYCDKSGITERELNDFGLFAAPCKCEEEGCHGWAMDARERKKISYDARGVTLL